jgi:alkylated DNA repair protein (DNA oxidative demethylase)
MPEPLAIAGARVWPGHLDRPAQAAMVAAVRAVVAAAPLSRYVTRSGAALSVRMTACGRVGWVSDRAGYRYADRHPSGVPWPPIPACVLAVWRALSGWPADPDSCLVNWYGPEARMGLHQDRDERDFAAPVLSISLGDTGVFRIGGTARGGRTTRIDLASGDVLALAGPSRLAWHGLARILPGTSDLLPVPGRINLTLRVVD